MKDEKRALYQLILTQLTKDGFFGIASALSEATLIVPSKISKEEDDRLLKLVQLGLQRDRDIRRGIIPERNLTRVEPEDEFSMDTTQDDLLLTDEAKGRCLDFELEEQTGQVPKRSFPNFTTKFITTHKNACRVAKFSPDGKFVSTGSEDTSIKLLDVDKMRSYNQVKSEHGEEFAPARPVIRTFYDHVGAINDLEFHPINPILASCSKDRTIKFYDHSQANVKRSFRFIQDAHNVRSIHFHPSGDFLLAGTDYPVIKLYDMNTLQCYINPKIHEHHSMPINSVKYAPEGNIFASCSKDGTIKLWDATGNTIINTIQKPHSGFEPTSIQFSKNQKYLLSGGKDATIRLWDLSTGRQLRHIITGPQWKFRLQVTFNYTEDYVITSDELTYSAIVWDIRTGEVVQRLSGHTNIIPWIASSPVEPCLMTCSNDFRARFWVEDS